MAANFLLRIGLTPLARILALVKGFRGVAGIIFAGSSGENSTRAGIRR